MEFKLVYKIVKNIQDTIYNTGRDVVAALKPHTFKTKTTNFPKVQKINGIVSVSNQKRVEKELKVNGTTQKTILKWLKSFKLPKEIKVSNFPMQLKQPPFPTEFNVSNFPKQKEFPKNIRVTNQPTEEIKDLGKLLKQVKTAISALKLDPTIKVQAAKPDSVVVPAPQVSVTQQEIDYEKLANSFPEPVEAKEFDYEKLADVIASRMVTVGGGGGGAKKEGLDDLTRQYNICDKDVDNDVKYYGFTGRAGDWYILKEDTTANQYRYVKGSSSYETNWANRASLDYDYYYKVF